MRSASSTVTFAPAFALALAVFAAAPVRGAESAAGGVRWTPPAGWTKAPDRPMRVATYTVPAAPGQEGGECGIFFFGKGQGGSIEDNISRWAAQFEGGPAPKKSEKTVHGLKVHEVELSGTYLSPGGPMMQSQGKKKGWRLIGAIVEAPDGLVFFKCVGPAPTIEKAAKDFEAMIGSLTKAANA